MALFKMCAILSAFEVFISFSALLYATKLSLVTIQLKLYSCVMLAVQQEIVVTS